MKKILPKLTPEIQKQHAMYLMACRKYFAFFMRETFRVVNPGIKFKKNWHVDLIAHYLQAVSEGKIKRLIINIPPRSMKSTITSICWPAWIIGNDPSKRIICASYSQHLSDKLSLDSRHLVKSWLYSKIFPNVKMVRDQNKKNKYMFSDRGFRFATSVGGTTTGEGGDILILDDPHNALDVISKKRREKSIQWFQQSFLSRLDDKKNGAIVLVMQRLHQEDLTGFLLKTQPKEWTVLSIPAICQEDTTYEINGLCYDYKKNELLHQTREGVEVIERLKRDLGTYTFSAQYLQDPLSINSGMIKKSWIEYYKTPTSIASYETIIQSWDTAIKSGDENSYSVCTTWGRLQGNFYLLDVYRDKAEYPTLKRKIVELYRKWNPDRLLIEDKASGQALLQDLKKEHYQLPLVPIKVNKDKFTRFASVSPLFEYGRIFIDQHASWRLEYEQEILTFPNSKHNDQVDSTSQYLNYILSATFQKPRIRQL